MSFKVWSCESCIYFQPMAAPVPADKGECRRFAPRAKPAAGEKREIPSVRDQDWPLVMGADWCGEWRAR